ncbi:CaiB/BaiF CoA transferase family protein [Desertihabitans aurantiacus]|uniref:CaiB/BaiF CoA transferase family protein n=1 Tax=Desertihabitans aurantiacus TaxID=2282477 RepID=UPI000DF7362D|nr:CoA transferase [Desertihabitans aurantiacus]
MTPPPALLEGVRVLDLTNVLAGPYACYQLALLGADVVKVEVPGQGDLARQLGADPARNADRMGTSFIAQNSGKRSIEVDLKSEDGRATLRRLVAGADVLCENFRPGVLERLGFGWEELRAINPRLVYCAISGFGQDGPLRDRPAYDQIIQGLSGMMATTGDPSTGPLRAGYPVADTLGGMAAAMAVAAALVRARRDGVGARLDVSMLETAITAMGWVVSNQLIAGVQHEPIGNENMTAAPSGTFATGDGLINIAANKAEQFAALCVAVGRPDLVTDERFAERETRKRHRAALRAELEAALAARSAADWEERLAAVGVPAGRVLSVADALAAEQVVARGLVQQVEVDGEPVPVLGHGVRVDGQVSRPRSGPPRLGAHTAEVLAELDASEPTRAEVTAGEGRR